MSNPTFCFATSDPPRLVSVRGGTEALLGYSQHELLTAKISLKDLVHPDDAEIMGSIFSNCLEIRSGCINVRLRHADGRVRCVRGCFTKRPARTGKNVVLELVLDDARNIAEPSDAFLLKSFKALIEHTDDHIYVKNRNHVILAASRAFPFLTETAKNAAELVGKTDYDIYPEAIANLSYRLENQAIDENRHVNQVQQLTAQDGSSRWIDDRKYPITGPDGAVAGIFGIAPDITREIEGRLKLRESQDLLKLFIEHAPVALAMLDREMRYLAVSRKWIDIHDLDGRDLVGQIHYEILPNIPETWKGLHRRALAGEVVPPAEVCRTKTDGSDQWMMREIRPWLSGEGQVGGIIIFAEDITERKHAETALRESEESLKETERIAGLGSYCLEVGAGRWTSSAVLNQLLGIDEEFERTHEGWFALVHPDDREMLTAYFTEEVLGKRVPFDGEYRIVRPSDGEVRWIHSRGRVEPDGLGNPKFFRGTAQDITERKQAETALRESEESLREAQRIAGLGGYLLDIDAGMWTSSDVMDEIFGIDKEFERTVDGWAALIHPDDRASMLAYFKDEVLSQRGPFDREYRIVRQTDGAVRWVHGLGRLELDAEGRPVKMPGTIQDITEARQAQETLRESRHLLQLFIEHAPVALAMFDREMRYLSVSRRWLEDYGLVGRDVIGQSHYEVFPDVPEQWVNAHQCGLAGETLHADDDRFERADGRVQWVRWEIIPWRTGDGSVGGIVLFAEDVTERKRAEKELFESRELLEIFIKHAPVALAMFDREMRYLSVSRRWLEDYHLVESEIIGRSHYEVVPDLPERWKEGHRRGLAGERVHVEEDRFDRADGAVEWSRWEVIPWRTGDGSVGGIVLFAEDVTERRAVEDRLRLGATVFTGAREGITITDRTGNILEVNDAFTRITGYTRKEVLGRNPRVLKSGLHSKEFYESMWTSLNREGRWSGEIWNRTKSGDIYPEMLTINAIHNASGEVEQYVGLFTDITELKEKEQRLEHIVRYDALTGLPNRALFADRLRQAMAHTHWKKGLLAVASFDVDGFKGINDRYGQATGDGLLTALAFRMKRTLREGDTLARLGGDEFAAVILDLEDNRACLATLNRLLAAAGEEAQIGEVMLRVSASAGVTFYPQEEDVDADVLLRQAGQAMYQAKLAGRNCFRMFDPGQDQIVRGRHENIEHIRQALAARQFVLYYQPKVNMRTGKVIGAEALIRWQHPERGLLPPGMFLPVIEDHPLAVELGEWVVETALTQMESWMTEGFELPVSVNVSAIELQSPDFADRLRARLAAHPQVKPADLELEVVETSAVQDVMRTSQLLTACREIGVAIGLDDFGTGYSSLTYLKRLPANVLKIDQSFVRDMLEEPENLTILEGVLGLAAAFHRRVIAEGVETAEHGLMLLQMGCDLAQGFGIAASMPARELRAWAAAWRPDPRWSEVPIVRAENRPVLLAAVEHRAWLGALEASLQGKRAVPPPLDASVCRLAMWLEDEKRSSHGTDSAVQAIESLHGQVHELAAEIVASQADGPNPKGLARLRQLHYLQDKCMKRLKTFA
jgi:diguanylate cyclase (GGDEF)-like protein/PAS domain S-box-containing protein